MTAKWPLLTMLMLLLALLAAGCSTTSALAEDETLLYSNRITIENDRTYSPTNLEPYIKQKPNNYFIGHWNPFLYVYNWSNGTASGWDRFCEKLGQAPVAYDPSLVDASIKSMLNHLEYQGWYFNRIESRATTEERKTSVEYDVTLGKRYPVDSIDFFVESPDLAALMKTDSANCTISKGDWLSQESLEAESERLAQMFRNNGYWGFSKNYFFYYADTTRVPGQADLFVKIRNYTRNESEANARPHTKYTLGTVAVTPQRGMKVRPEFINSLNKLKPGDLYREKDINTTYERFTSVPLFSSVNVMLRQSEDDSTKVDCHILLTPAKVQAIKLNLEGSFNSTGFFGVAPAISYTHRNIFGGSEVLSVGFRGNFQFKFHDPVRATEYSVTSGLSIPWSPSFFLLHDNVNLPRTDIQVNYNYQNRAEYVRSIFNGSYGYSWNVSRRFYAQWNPASLSYVSSKVDSVFFSGITDPYLKNSFNSHIDFGGNGSFYYTTNSSINPKTSYFYTRLQVNIAGNLMSILNGAGIYKQNEDGSRTLFGLPYSQYARGELQAVRTLRFGKDNQFGFAARALAGLGYAYGNSMALPFEQLFYAGGANSLRGWHARSVGPGSAPRDSSFTIANQSGDMHLEANVEFRFPVVWKLYGCLFADAGNIWNISGQSSQAGERDIRGVFSVKDMFRTSALDWGLGARLDFDLILVRLDLGFKTYDPLVQKWRGPSRWFAKDGYALHFGIGYPF